MSNTYRRTQFRKNADYVERLTGVKITLGNNGTMRVEGGKEEMAKYIAFLRENMSAIE